MTSASPALATFVVVFAGLFGLVIGSFLNVVAYRVPAGISLMRESRCPHCGAAVRPWQNVPVISWIALRGKCAECGAAISPRYPLVELVTGLAFAMVAWVAVGISTGSTALVQSMASQSTGTTSGSGGTVAFWLVLVAFFYFAAISIVLTLIDLDTRRLPNAIVLPSYLVAGILFTIAAAVTHDWSPLLRAGIGMAILYGFYLVLRLVRPGGMGGGDVKLAGVVGIYLGWLGWGALIIGAFAAFVLGGLFGMALIGLRRAGRKSAIPFGPWMLAGAWVGVFFGQPIADWYLGMLSG